MKRLIQGMFFLFLLAVGTSVASAQTVRGEVMRLQQNDPRAVRATELLAPLLRGNVAATQAYIKQHAVAGFNQGEDAVSIPAAARQFAGFTVDAVMRAPGEADGLMVFLRKGEDLRAVKLRVETVAPYRLLAIENSNITVRRGGAPRRP